MTGKIKLPHASGNSMSIAAPATNPASDLSLKLPATVGTANQFLKNSGTAGTLEFSNDLTFDGTKLILGNSGTGNGSSAVQAFIAHGSTASESGFRSIDTTSVAAGVGGEVSFAGKYNTGAQDYAYTGHIRGIKENATAGNTACALTFHTRPTATAPQERMRIHSSGAVTKPNNPVFRVNGAHSWVTLSNNASLILPFSNELLDVGSNYDTSNYRFTAPVAGKYYINVSLYWKAGTAATSNYITLEFQKNGSADTSGIDYGIYGTANDTTGSQYLTTDSIQNLSASDYVDVKIIARGGSIDYYMGHSQFNGFLIG